MSLHKLKYTKVPYGQSQYSIELEDHMFSGVKFTIDRIAFDEDKGTLKYNYDIIENKCTNYDQKQFEYIVGDLIMQILEEGIVNNDLVYAGGVDEN
jgi:hypothetical protein